MGTFSSCLQVARAFGGRQVIAVDVNEKKLENATKMGATHTVNASSESVVDRIRVWIHHLLLRKVWLLMTF